jgi:hypothetical protein
MAVKTSMPTTNHTITHNKTQAKRTAPPPVRSPTPFLLVKKTLFTIAGLA